MTVKTRADLVADIADAYGEFLSLTVTSGSTTTILDTANLYQPDSYWVGHYAYVRTDAGGASAAPEGEERAVTGYDRASATLTVSPAFTVAVAAGDIVELSSVQRHVLNRAINAGIREAGFAWLVRSSDESTVDISDDVYEYTLPTDIVYLDRVLLREDTDEPWGELPRSNWRAIGEPGSQELSFITWDALSEDYTVRLEYHKLPSELTTDSGSPGLGEPVERGLYEFVYNYALYWLHNRMANKSDADGAYQMHYTQSTNYYKTAMGQLQRALSQGRSRSIRTVRPTRARG